jgi:hypothetical protein
MLVKKLVQVAVALAKDRSGFISREPSRRTTFAG